MANPIDLSMGKNLGPQQINVQGAVLLRLPRAAGEQPIAVDAQDLVIALRQAVHEELKAVFPERFTSTEPESVSEPPTLVTE